MFKRIREVLDRARRKREAKERCDHYERVIKLGLLILQADVLDEDRYQFVEERIVSAFNVLRQY